MKTIDSIFDILVYVQENNLNVGFFPPLYKYNLIVLIRFEKIIHVSKFNPDSPVIKILNDKPKDFENK